ncbi:hypothetical protein M378DRAFT_652185 [Amanita muscaria Koide BX008]|uniref:Uncharacterized protein n=1 Tax=Amanita muscaria (strain Koide BX008) TaxID=946122 RepID=A0A0C2SMA7_AMAMK|nr:hypothetical protein M378DRAFT_652185 [Amanita muscaria Koide BX008]
MLHHKSSHSASQPLPLIPSQNPRPISQSFLPNLLAFKFLPRIHDWNLFILSSNEFKANCTQLTCSYCSNANKHAL